LENTFLSIPKLLPNVFPTLKYFTKLCHQVWDSESAIASIDNIPTLFISGLKDELIPPAHMKKLHDTMPNQSTKVWKEIPDGNHNDTCTKPGYFQAIEAFFVEYVHKN
jgi:pimeloyl-ACP methyl ester carboxylesterase